MKSRTTSMHRFGLFIGPFAALLVYFMATARPVHATFPGTNGQIAFAQITPDGPANVFVASFDGLNVQQVPLVNPAETFGVPVWSPDGTKLLISHTIRLDSAGQCCLFQPATVDPSGSNFNQLAPPNPPGASSDGMDCGAWYPGGTRLLCGFSGDQPGVFSISASDGGDAVRLTTNPYGANGGMDAPTDISPDGKQFVFLRLKTKMNPNDTTPDTQPALFVENTDGSGLRQLTASGMLSFGLPNPAAHWSPDGTRIIGEIGNGKIFTIRPNGSHFTAIDLQVTAPYFAFWPGWSPDGTRIIFCMFINGGEGIYTANPNGSSVTQVTFTMNLGANFTNLFNGPSWGTHPLQ